MNPYVQMLEQEADCLDDHYPLVTDAFEAIQAIAQTTGLTYYAELGKEMQAIVDGIRERIDEVNQAIAEEIWRDSGYQPEVYE